MSIDEWKRIRAYLARHAWELSTQAAKLYPDSWRVEGTSLLASPSWVPEIPLDIVSVHLDRRMTTEVRTIAGFDGALQNVLPVRQDGPTYRSYSEAMADLAPPRVFENRSTYRLTKADLAGSRCLMAFERGTYFDSIDIGEACAHEYAVMTMGVISDYPLRTLVGDPRDLARRPVNVAVSALTLRVDRATGDVTFPLHWRDPNSVGHARGLYQVLPVGIFQAINNETRNQDNDFDLWRCLVREYAEELLGKSEDYGPPGTSIDYAAWPIARSMADARADGSIRPWILGMGVDPLTFAVDLLGVVIFDAPVFDELFGSIVEKNAEGNVLFGSDRDFRFTDETVHKLTQREPMQAAGAAVLRLASRHRQLLLS